MLICRRFVICLLLVPLLGASPTRASEYHVALVGALTNTYAFVGVPIANGVKLAVDRINASDTLGSGNSIRLQVEDSASDRAQAVTLVTKFGNDSTNLILLGPTSTIDVLASGPAAAQANIPQIVVAPSPEVLKIGPYIFRVTEATTDYMSALGNFAVERLKVRRCAFVTNGDNEGLVLQRNIVRDIFVAHGGTIVADDVVKSRDTDFLAISTKIAALKPDCLALNLTPEPAANLITQMRQAGLADEVKIITNNAAAAQAFLKSGGKAVEGTYVISEFTPPGVTEEAHEFTKAYIERYGVEPDNWAALGYASVQLAAAAIKVAGPAPTRELIRDALARTTDIPVVIGSGKLSIDANRATHFGTTVLKVQDGKFVVP